MPISFAAAKTPQGKPYLRTVSSGVVTAADAQSLTTTLAPGQPLAGLPILSLVDPGATFSAEARQAFTAIGGEGAAAMPVAVVVSSAPMRVMLGFIIRLSGAAAATRFFGKEEEALAWLEEKLSATP